MSNSILDAKVLEITLFFINPERNDDRAFRPSEVAPINAPALLKQAAHQQVEDPNYLNPSYPKGQLEQRYYYLPNTKISYREAEQLNMLHLFENGNANILVAKKWLLSQDIWKFGLEGDYGMLYVVVTTPDSEVLQLIGKYSDCLTLKEGFNRTYILNPETTPATAREAN